MGNRWITAHITECLRNMGLEQRLTTVLDLEHDLRLLTAVAYGLMWTSLTLSLDICTASSTGSTDGLIQWYIHSGILLSHKQEIKPSLATLIKSFGLKFPFFNFHFCNTQQPKRLSTHTGKGKIQAS